MSRPRSAFWRQPSTGRDVSPRYHGSSERLPSLGQLWSDTGRLGEARRLVKGVYDQFTEGFKTPDLVEARQFLDRLGASEG